MLVSWNVRGLNKASKLRDISSRLLKLLPEIVILMKTRVKHSKAKLVRDKLNLKRRYLDNYQYSENGRVQIEWDNTKLDIKHINSTNQFIRCGVFYTMINAQKWIIFTYEK